MYHAQIGKSYTVHHYPIVPYWCCGKTTSITIRIRNERDIRKREFSTPTSYLLHPHNVGCRKKS